MIAQAETQSVLFKHENEAMKNALSSSNIPIPIIAPISKSISEQNFSEQSTDITTPASTLQEHPQSDFSISGSPQWQSPSPSLVSMTFDEMIDTSCLQITPLNNFIPDNNILMNSPDIFSFPSDSFVPVATSDPTPAPNFPGLNPELSKALPRLTNDDTSPVSTAALKDLSIIAINFILAFVSFPAYSLHLFPMQNQLMIL
jgi:hypothetical protein